MFDRNRFLSNLEELRKQRNYTIGEIENKIGLSKGYFSRLRGTTKEQIPQVDTIIKLAEVLEVSESALLHYDFSAGTYNILKLDALIRRLMEDTKQGKVYWIKATGGDVCWNSSFTKEPIFSYTDDGTEQTYIESLLYETHLMKPSEWFGDCYKGEYADGRVFMLMSIIEGKKVNWYAHIIKTVEKTDEIRTEGFGITDIEKYNTRVSKTLYSTFDDAAKSLLPITHDLVTVIERSLRDVRVDLDVMNDIDEFLEEGKHKMG